MSISLNSAALLSGNGINVNSLAAQVLAPEKNQLQLYQQQQSALQTQAGLLNGINDDVNNLSSAVNALTDILGPLAAQTVTSSQSSIVTGSAQSTAAPAAHTIEVTALAAQGTIYTDAVPNAETSVLPNGAQSADLRFRSVA